MKFTRFPKYTISIIILIVLSYFVFRKMNYFIEGNDASPSDEKYKQNGLQDTVIRYTNDIFDRISSLITKKTKESENTTEMIFKKLDSKIAAIDNSVSIDQSELDKWDELVKSVEHRLIKLRSNIVYETNTGASFKIGNDKIVGVINKYV